MALSFCRGDSAKVFPCIALFFDGIPQEVKKKCTLDRGVDRHRYLLISTSSDGVCSRRVNSNEWGGSKGGGGDGGGDRLGTSAVSTLLKLQGGKHFRARKRKIGGEDGKENSSLSSIELANTVRAEEKRFFGRGPPYLGDGDGGDGSGGDGERD
uniref:Uncharacterized protein n=1 Tax=Vespula pensylvanica TaxID=30213 RepID=A0A834PHF4_VESPE|nr:hypothetical protein H0235_001901 [Vespula pensylvanica]